MSPMNNFNFNQINQNNNQLMNNNMHNFNQIMNNGNNRFMNQNLQINNNMKDKLDNNIYIKKIEELKKQLNNEKIKNKQLVNENNNLKEKINKFNNEIKEMQELKDAIIKSLEVELTEKNNELQQLILSLSQNSNVQSKYKIKEINPGEEIISINFVSMGSNDIGHFSLVCKNTDLFIREEERLYEKFPQFKKYETFFEVNGKRIKRFLSHNENKIKDNDIINIFFIEE